MAKNHIVQLTDDLDGGDATRTVKFGFEGSTYEIDLNDSNVEEFAEAMKPYVEAARRVAAPTPAPVPRGGSRSASNAYKGVGGAKAALIRQWAPQNGYELSKFGRIPGEVIAA